ncbi:MAG: adhesin transport system outer membrane protein [Alphaproteobacteria bacterium]|jgi:adhesin transport system outer membrane protein
MALANKNYLLHKIFLAQMNERYQYELGTEGDVGQARSRLYRAEERIEFTKKDIEIAKSNYEHMVGVKYLNEQKLNSAFEFDIMLSVIDIIQRAHIKNPSILMVRAEEKAGKMEVKAAASEFMPEIDLKLSFDREENAGGVRGPDNTAQALVSFKYNLYNGGADTAKKRRRIELLGEAKAKRRQKIMDIENTINSYWHEYNLSISRHKLLKKTKECRINRC